MAEPAALSDTGTANAQPNNQQKKASGGSLSREELLKYVSLQKKKIKVRDAEIAKLRSTCTTLRAKADEAPNHDNTDQENNGVELNGLRNDVGRLQDSLQEAQTQAKTYASAAETNAQRVEELEQALQTSDTERVRFQNETESLNERLAATQLRVTELVEELRVIKEQTQTEDEQQQVKEKLEQERQDAARIQQLAEVREQELLSNIETLQESHTVVLEEMQRSHVEATAAAVAAAEESGRFESNTRETELRQEVERIDSQLNEKVTVEAKLREDLTQANENLLITNQELIGMRESFAVATKEHEKQLAESTNLFATARSEVGELESELESLKNAVPNSDAVDDLDESDLPSVKARVVELEPELEEVRERAASSSNNGDDGNEANLLALQARVVELESELEKALQSKMASNDEVDTENEAKLASRVAELESELEERRTANNNDVNDDNEANMAIVQARVAELEAELKLSKRAVTAVSTDDIDNTNEDKLTVAQARVAELEAEVSNLIETHAAALESTTIGMISRDGACERESELQRNVNAAKEIADQLRFDLDETVVNWETTRQELKVSREALVAQKKEAKQMLLQETERVEGLEKRVYEMEELQNCMNVQETEKAEVEQQLNGMQSNQNMVVASGQSGNSGVVAIEMGVDHQTELVQRAIQSAALSEIKEELVMSCFLEQACSLGAVQECAKREQRKSQNAQASLRSDTDTARTLQRKWKGKASQLLKQMQTLRQRLVASESQVAILQQDHEQKTGNAQSMQQLQLGQVNYALKQTTTELNARKRHVAVLLLGCVAAERATRIAQDAALQCGWQAWKYDVNMAGVKASLRDTERKGRDVRDELDLVKQSRDEQVGELLRQVEENRTQVEGLQSMLQGFELQVTRSSQAPRGFSIADVVVCVPVGDEVWCCIKTPEHSDSVNMTSTTHKEKNENKNNKNDGDENRVLETTSANGHEDVDSDVGEVSQDGLPDSTSSSDGVKPTIESETANCYQWHLQSVVMLWLTRIDIRASEADLPELLTARAEREANNMQRQLQQRLAAAVADREGATDELARYKRQAHLALKRAKAAASKDLQARIETQDDSIAQLQSELAKVAQERDAINCRVEELRGECSQAQASAQDAEQRIETLDAQVNSANAEVKHLETKYKNDTTASEIRLSEHEMHANQVLQQVKIELEAALGAQETLMKEKEDLAERAEVMCAEADRRSARIDELEAQVAKFQSALQDVTKSVQQQERERQNKREQDQQEQRVREEEVHRRKLKVMQEQQAVHEPSTEASDVLLSSAEEANGGESSSASERTPHVGTIRAGGSDPPGLDATPIGGDNTSGIGGVNDIVGNGSVPGYFARHFKQVQAQHAEERVYLQGRIGELEASLEDTETESRLLHEQLKVIKEQYREQERMISRFKELRRKNNSSSHSMSGNSEIEGRRRSIDSLDGSELDTNVEASQVQDVQEEDEEGGDVKDEMDNLTYLKNVLVKYMCAKDPLEQEMMLPVLVTLLKLSPDETQQIKTQIDDAFLRAQTRLSPADALDWAGGLFGFGGGP